MSRAPLAHWCIDDVPLGLLAVTDDGLVLQANARLGQMLDLDPAQLAGKRIDQVFTPAARLLYHSYLLPLLKLHGHVAEVSLPLMSQRGERIDTVLTASRQAPQGSDHTGCVRFAFLPWRERRRLQDQLLSAKRSAEQVPGLLFELREGPDGQQAFPYASESLRALFGVPPQEAMLDAERVWQTLHPEDLPMWREALRASAKDLQPLRCEYRVLLRGSVAWRETHASPQRLADGACLWHGYTADVTERKALLAQAMERDAAERASRAKSEFLARVSHELRTPLNGILGFSQLLLAPKGGLPDEAHRRQVQYIEAAGQALLQLVDEVLDISHIESGAAKLNLEQVDVVLAMKDAAALMAPVAQQRQVRFSLPADCGPLWARVDAHRLSQCLLNLLSNAVKYGPVGGVVRLAATSSAGRLTVSVTDQGPGLSQAQRDHLFEPFNRLGAERSQTEGSGLGLVITKGWIELMGGQLRFGNVPGGGACFSFDLACARPPSACAPGDAALSSERWHVAHGLDEPDDSLPACEVLYVEDNEINAVLMASVLQLRPRCRLHVAPDAASALAMAQTCVPDLLLLDMHLPDLNGQELLTRLRRMPGLAQVPAVAVSADAIGDNMACALSAGFVDYWTKPLALGKVLPALDALLDSLAPRTEAN